MDREEYLKQSGWRYIYTHQHTRIYVHPEDEKKLLTGATCRLYSATDAYREQLDRELRREIQQNAS